MHSIATGLEKPQPEYVEDVLDREEADSLPEPYIYKDIVSGKLITKNSQCLTTDDHRNGS